ncbi:MAG TPA: VOC family protein [Planctomycetota bacterium]|nr:VOC family protein [Planctomycetota bacterium]
MTDAAPVLHAAMPCLLVPDVARTVAWYQKVLGFQHGGVWCDGDEAFGIARMGDGVGFHFKSAGAHMPALDPAPTAETAKLDACIRMHGDAIRPLHMALGKAGVQVLGEPRDQPWQQRELLVRDPDGHVLCFGGDLTGEWPAGAVAVSPELPVADPEVTAAFFREGLGFTETRLWGDPPTYLIAGRDGAKLHFRRGAPGEIRSNAPREVWDAYVWCDGVDELGAEVQRRGVPLERGPQTMAYGMRELDVLDPDGHVVCFGAPAES